MVDGTIEFCTFFEDRKQFQYGEETYSSLTLFCVESGSFSYSVGDGEQHTVNRGQVVVCPPHVSFRRKMREPTSFCMIRLTPNEPIHFGDEPITPHDVSRFFYDLRALHGCRFCHDFNKNRIDGHYCLDIWYLLQPREYENEDTVTKAFSYISRHYTESISVAALAREAGYSTVHFINCFRRRYGMTPIAQITHFRILRAEELLRNTALSVKMVALAVGYGDEFYFSRVFRRHRGVSPRQFRKQESTEALGNAGNPR